MKLKQTFVAAAVGVAALSLAACGSGGDPLGGTTAAPTTGGGDTNIVVGSANFTENQILGEIYAQALTAKGLKATTKPNIGSREVYIKALQDKSISVIPEYTGNLLKFFDKDASATTEDEIIAALPKAVGSDLKVLKASKAADQDVYAVTKAFSEQNGVKSLDDLKKLPASTILGGPSELKERPYGPPGLKGVYGATLTFKAYDSPAVKVKDLNGNKIQVATFFTTDAAILDNGYVTLTDPQSMILPQQVVPLVSAEVAANTTAASALEAVQAALTTEELTMLNKKVDVDHDDANAVAAEWLKSKSLG